MSLNHHCSIQECGTMCMEKYCNKCPDKKPKIVEPICRYCWDKKSYSTCEGGSIAMGDFVGDKPYLVPMRIIQHPCPRCNSPKRNKEIRHAVEDVFKSEYIDIPFLFEFDYERVIGSVKIQKEYADMMPKWLPSIGYQEKPTKEVLNFSLVRDIQPKEIVICAAVKSKEGNVFACHRHGDGFRTIQDSKQTISSNPDDQGFITSKNRFVTREEGRKLQDEAGIPSADREGYRGNTLFSEDLY